MKYFLNLRLLALGIVLILSYDSYAVKGEIIVHNEEVAKASCKLEIAYHDLAGKKGVCSAVTINHNQILTAKHCLYHLPSLMPQGISDPIRNPFKDDDYIAKDKIDIICDQKEYQAVEFKTHPHTDLALITVNEKIEHKLDIITSPEIEKLVKGENKKCYAFGFGFNNENILGDFYGVFINKFKIYSQAEAYLEIELDADFKHMAFSLANSMFGKVFMNSSFFPRLVNRYKKPIETIDGLEEIYEKFKDELNKNNITENDVFDAVKGPFFKKVFFSYFMPIYKEAYGVELEKFQFQAEIKQLSSYRYILNTSSFSGVKSAIDYGDSGGAFVCQIGSKLKLTGINSRILTDSNLGYQSKPWEPMNYRPLERQTKNGEVIPLDLKTLAPLF